ncbi:MAG: NADH:ubiquinone reductase (Na(+)-transporting) subunit A, partial [Bacteroidia bacterium]
GKLFSEGIYDPERVIAITGSEVKHPGYAKARLGVSIDYLLKDNLTEGKNRVISGNVLFGTKIAENGYLGYYDQQITVIPEGDEPEMLGWLIPSYPRPSISKTFLSYLTPNKKYKVNTGMHGEERAFVVTNEYEKVLPMDILPVQLIKACLANDLEAMEALGIFEVVEEDFALCEFVCTSKAPVQEILADGLALIEKEG